MKNINIPNARFKNARGEWVPAIPEPYFHLIRKECECGEKFITRYRYNAHYALTHILEGF